MTVQGSDMNQVDDRVTLGIALMLGFCAVAPLLDVAAKLAAPTIPVSQITTTRFLLQGVIMLPICLWMRHPITIERSLLGLLALRGFFLILATYCFMAAIAVMPIADALAIVFIEPFILLVMGVRTHPLLRQHITRRHIHEREHTIPTFRGGGDEWLQPLTHHLLGQRCGCDFVSMIEDDYAEWVEDKRQAEREERDLTDGCDRGHAMREEDY